jgi:hypothetical protein
MSTVLVSQNGLGLKKSPRVYADVESVGFLNGQASFASYSSLGEQDIDGSIDSVWTIYIVGGEFMAYRLCDSQKWNISVWHPFKKALYAGSSSPKQLKAHTIEARCLAPEQQ